MQKANEKLAKPAAFLDRDGVIIEYVDHLHRRDQVRLREGVPAALSKLKKLGYAIFVVTNQPMVAKGMLTEAELAQIHDDISRAIGIESIIDRFYYCPHQESDQCNCRKPKTGMLEKATSDFAVDLKNSFMVGDTWRDVQCAQNFGIRAFAVTGGAGYPYQQEKIQPERLFSGLPELVEQLS